MTHHLDLEDVRVAWEDDWLVGSHVEEFGSAYSREPTTCETCSVYAVCKCCGSVVLVASLSCIDDADDAYRREIEQDLISEVAA